MPFNYNLLQQVKQAMQKAAAPVPPEEVTGEKPYVRPQYLEPQQPKTKEQSREEFLRSMADESARATAEPMSEQEIDDNISDPLKKLFRDVQHFRAYKNIPSNADLSAYPKVQEEYKKLYVPKIKELIAALPNEEVDEIKKVVGGGPGLGYFLENAHIQPDAPPTPALPGIPGVPLIDPRKRLSRAHSEHINQYTSNYLKDFKDKALGTLHDVYSNATPEDFGKIRGTALTAAKQIDPYSIGLNAAKHFLNNSKNPTNVYEYGNLTPIGYEIYQRERMNESTRQNTFRMLDQYAARQRARTAQQNPVAQQKPALPASHMDAGPPMADRRFSRMDIDAAKPEKLQPTKPQEVKTNLPAIPSESPLTRRLSGGRGY